LKEIISLPKQLNRRDDQTNQQEYFFHKKECFDFVHKVEILRR